MAGDPLQPLTSAAPDVAGRDAFAAVTPRAVAPAQAPAIDDPRPVTPFEVVHQSGLLRLRRYAPTAKPGGLAPVLLVYSLIKRPYVLDLIAERSVVGNLLRQGFTVYLTDWLPPGPGDSGRGFDAYLNRDLDAAVERIRALEGADRVSLIGPCFGGLLAVVYAALEPAKVGRLVPLAMPFRMRPLVFPGAIEYMVRACGNIPAWFIRATLNASVPSRADLSVYLAQDLADDESESDTATRLRAAVQRWMNSDVPVAGRVFCDIMRDAYLDARLADNRLYVGGRHAALERIQCPVLNVAGERDPLAPPRTCAGLVTALGSESASDLVFPAGHLGLMVSRAAHERLWPRIGAWLARGEPR